MIYTITISPAIDYVVHLDTLESGATNRSSKEEYFFGGKGINVSQVLKELGKDSIALGFVSGFTGQALENGLRESGIKTDFVHLKNGITRINVKIKAEQETEINGQGTAAGEADLEILLDMLNRLNEDDILVVSGNVPVNVPGDIYNRIFEQVEDLGIKVVLDTTGELLMNALKYKPFLIKPNIDELKEIYGNDIDAATGAAKLQEAGARNVIVSLGKDGAFLLDENGNEHRSGVCKGKVINTVGAGDSMVAGFVAGYLETGDFRYALDMGSAAGSATALSPGLANREKINECFNELINL